MYCVEVPVVKSDKGCCNKNLTFQILFAVRFLFSFPQLLSVILHGVAQSTWIVSDFIDQLPKMLRKKYILHNIYRKANMKSEFFLEHPLSVNWIKVRGDQFNSPIPKAWDEDRYINKNTQIHRSVTLWSLPYREWTAWKPSSGYAGLALAWLKLSWIDF